MKQGRVDDAGVNVENLNAAFFSVWCICVCTTGRF